MKEIKHMIVQVTEKDDTTVALLARDGQILLIDYEAEEEMTIAEIVEDAIMHLKTKEE